MSRLLCQLSYTAMIDKARRATLVQDVTGGPPITEPQYGIEP